MKINTDVQFAIMAEELKTLKKKNHQYKSKTSSSKKYYYSDSEDEKLERNSMRATDHYQLDPYDHPRKKENLKKLE